MNFSIQVIPHEQHRYSTCGDYWVDEDGTVQVRVSDLGNWKFETLIAVHELVELLICKYQGISIASIDKFDMDFEEDRKKGLYTPEEEPGDHKNAPYREAHFIATTVERILAVSLGVNWGEYEYAVHCLSLTEANN